MDWITPLIGLGGSFLSGLFGSNAQDDALAAQANMQREQNAWATGMAQQAQTWGVENWRREAQWNRQMADTAFKRSVAQDAVKVQRLVNDAKKAGIHPLAALGATGLSSTVAQPVPAGGTSPGPQASSFPVSVPTGVGNPWGDAIASGVDQLLRFRQAEMDYQLRKEEIGVMRAQRRSENMSTLRMLADGTSRSRIAGARAAATGGSAGGVKGGLDIGDVIASVTGAPQGPVPVKGVRKPADWTDFFGDDSWDNVIGPLQLVNTVLEAEAAKLAVSLSKAGAKWNRPLSDVLFGEGSRKRALDRFRGRPSPRGRQPGV